MNDLHVGIAGYGAIGQAVAQRLRAGVPGLALSAIGVRDPARTDGDHGGVRVVASDQLAEHADVIVECAPAAALPAIAEPALRAGRTLVVLSCAALLQHDGLIELARAGGGRILVPTGALLGLDAVAAAAEGTVQHVRLVTRKPPRGLAGAPHLVANRISVEGLTEPLRVFEGSAREAARGFPANVNVAAALSLAGIGADRTRVEIWADPALDRNTHTVEVESDAVRLRMTTEGVPSANPRTGRVVAQSVIALLRKQCSPLVVGT